MSNRFYLFNTHIEHLLHSQVLYYMMGASRVAQTVKNLPEMQETWVQSLGQEDSLEKEWLPTLVFLPGEFHGLRRMASYSPRCCKELDKTEQLTQQQQYYMMDT